MNSPLVRTSRITTPDSTDFSLNSAAPRFVALELPQPVRNSPEAATTAKIFFIFLLLLSKT